MPPTTGTTTRVVKSFECDRYDKAGEMVSRKATDGRYALYSYKLLLAHKDESGAVVIDFDVKEYESRSVTTKRHMQALLRCGYRYNKADV